MKDSYEFVAIFDYAKDGISISFPDLPGCLSCADTTEEAIKNAEEVLGLVLYDMEQEKENVNFSKVLQAALKDYLRVKRKMHI